MRILFGCVIKKSTKPTNDTYFHFAEVSGAKVRETIEKLKNGDSFDIFDLNVKIIKSIKEVILESLTKLINKCIKASCFPTCLKTAIVIPIYKSGEENEPSNYRPMALLPIFSKIMEKILLHQLNAYFETSNLFAKTQFGFRSKSNTVNAIESLVRQISSAFEEGQYAICSFLDLSKAFDCVSHTILLRKLYMYNLHPQSCKLITSK